MGNMSSGSVAAIYPCWLMIIYIYNIGDSTSQIYPLYIGDYNNPTRVQWNDTVICFTLLTWDYNITAVTLQFIIYRDTYEL